MLELEELLALELLELLELPEASSEGGVGPRDFSYSCRP